MANANGVSDLVKYWFLDIEPIERLILCDPLDCIDEDMAELRQNQVGSVTTDFIELACEEVYRYILRRAINERAVTPVLLTRCQPILGVIPEVDQDDIPLRLRCSAEKVNHLQHGYTQYMINRPIREACDANRPDDLARSVVWDLGISQTSTFFCPMLGCYAMDITFSFNEVQFPTTIRIDATCDFSTVAHEGPCITSIKTGRVCMCLPDEPEIIIYEIA
jgi:hypothetical protein